MPKSFEPKQPGDASSKNAPVKRETPEAIEDAELLREREARLVKEVRSIEKEIAMVEGVARDRVWKLELEHERKSFSLTNIIDARISPESISSINDIGTAHENGASEEEIDAMIDEAISSMEKVANNLPKAYMYNTYKRFKSTVRKSVLAEFLRKWTTGEMEILLRSRGTDEFEKVSMKDYKGGLVDTHSPHLKGGFYSDIVTKTLISGVENAIHVRFPDTNAEDCLGCTVKSLYDSEEGLSMLPSVNSDEERRDLVKKHIDKFLAKRAAEAIERNKALEEKKGE